jgi:serine/threonine-protein kinase
VEARIGSGGMGEVYRGVDTVLDRTVAIKVLLPQFARDANFVDRFRREAQAAARLNHPNLVGIYDSGADGETQFIVMEFIQGRTLDDFMGSGGRFTVPHAVEVAEKICEALAYAHVAGVIHRDIKPANVMVTRKGEVKVMDFGIARIVAGPQTAPQTSAVLGTAAYISPEQAQGQPVDGRSDIYSLGAVLYEMLTGRPPFTGDSPVAVAYKQVNESPVLPSIANPEVTPLLDAVLMRALAKNPANRYQTADDFRADLERARLGQDVLATPLMPPGEDATQVISRPQATAVLPPQESAPGSGRNVWLGVLIGIIVVAVLGGAGYLLAQGLLDNNDDSKDPFPVANVIGFTQERATDELEGAGLKVDPKFKVSDTAKPGRVIDQDPVPGTIVDPDSTVTITIAKAPPDVVIPTFTGLTLGDAPDAGHREQPGPGPDGRGERHRAHRHRHQPGSAGRRRGSAGDRDRDRRVGAARYGHRHRCHVSFVRLGEVRAPGAGIGRRPRRDRARAPAMLEPEPGRDPGSGRRHRGRRRDHGDALYRRDHVADRTDGSLGAVGMTIPYAVEAFAPDERAILERHFTNLDGPVFALTNLPEVVKGALFARYSRTKKSLRRLFLDEFAEDVGATGELTRAGETRAEQLYERVFVEYGDDSVAQLGGVHLACEQASQLLCKALEWGRLAAYLEQSTRYMRYDDRPGDAWRATIPPEIAGTCARTEVPRVPRHRVRGVRPHVRTDGGVLSGAVPQGRRRFGLRVPLHDPGEDL